MDSTRWQRLESLFHAALERDEASRSAFLLSETEDDATLRAEVEAMLAAHADTGALAVESRLIRDASGADSFGLLEPAPDSIIGNYRLVELIGRGGMGVVYRAERADGQYTQTVAIKLVRTGLVTPDLLQRLRAERQILARLEHPGIARLLDGGITDAGVPYLVMEHVRGLPITEHCDRERLTIEERLRVFQVVCRAVQHAHQNLVVHRDLKPSNILVTADGAVKLLDFGIARLIAADGEDAQDPQTRLSVMTPEYASPEQVRGENITTATDVYALGLLLHELLAGGRAQRIDGASLLSIQRMICEEELVAPSDSLAAASVEERDARARNRRLVRADTLRRRLRGDLDTITGTALRKDPKRRYASVEQLSGDVDRHLSGLPVLARPDTFGYRAAKFLRRHQTGVAAAAAVAISLMVGLAVALNGMVRARDAEQRAIAEAAAATNVSEFVVNLFRASDPAEARGDTVTARELLDRGALRVRTELSGQPEIHARMLRTIARAYESLGLFAAAVPLVEEELEIQRVHAGTESVEVANALERLSNLHGRTGDYEKARELAQQAVAMQERVSDPVSRELMNALNMLGTANGRLGNLAEARVALERALSIGERLLGTDDPSITGALNNLAIVHWQEGDPAGARPLYARALAILERDLGPDHPSVAHTLNNLALVHSQSGDYDGAAAAHERVLAIREKILAPDHPDIAETLNNLGVVLLDKGEFGRARDMLTRALAIRERALGAEHEYVASTLSNLGFALIGLDSSAAARPLLERALATLERVAGAGSARTSYPIVGLARVDRHAGRHDEAHVLYRRAIEIRETQAGADHPTLIPVLDEYAEYLREGGHPAEADSLARRADRIRPAPRPVS